MCAHELLALIDMVSKYKEYMESTISTMKTDLSETTNAMAEAYKTSISAKLSSGDLNLGYNTLKRARQPSSWAERVFKPVIPDLSFDPWLFMKCFQSMSSPWASRVLQHSSE